MNRARCLVVCHRSAVDAAVVGVRHAYPGMDVDVLAYGRLSEELPGPDGARMLSMPKPAGSRPGTVLAAARWLLGLRATHYAAAVIAQPHLGLSRVRGLLLLFVRAVGGRSAVLLDPQAQAIRRRVTLPLAVVDAARCLMLYAASHLIASAASRVVARCADDAEPDARRPARSGTVAYVRSDLDLAIADLGAGGSVAHTEGVLRALIRRGHSVTLMTTGGLAGMPSEAEEQRLPVVLRGNVPVEIAEFLSGLLQGLRPTRKPRDIAFVYQRYSLNNLAGMLLARRWGVPFVLEANGSEMKWRADWGSLRFPALAMATERLLIRSATRVAVVSENAAKDLLTVGAVRETLFVTPNAVEVERFTEAEPRELPFESDAFVIGFVGLFYPWHGVRYLAEAFARLHQRRPQARLLLLGDGEEAPIVRSILDKAGCLSACHMPGLVARDEVPGYLAACDVLASPHANVKDFIGSPIKIFEYLASGRAIVSSRVAQMGEILEHERTALLVEPEDPEALAEALERLMDDPALVTRLGDAAQREAREAHSWDARLASLLD